LVLKLELPVLIGELNFIGNVFIQMLISDIWLEALRLPAPAI